jgi:hypothetical protein
LINNLYGIVSSTNPYLETITNNRYIQVEFFPDGSGSSLSINPTTAFIGSSGTGSGYLYTPGSQVFQSLESNGYGSTVLNRGLYFQNSAALTYWRTTNLDLRNSWWIDFWAYIPNKATNVMFMGHGITSKNQGLHLRLISSGATIRFGFYANDTDFSAASISNSTWHHIAASYNHGTAEKRLWIDNVEITGVPQQIQSQYSYSTSESVFFGKQYGVSRISVSSDYSTGYQMRECVFIMEILLQVEKWMLITMLILIGILSL